MLFKRKMLLKMPSSLKTIFLGLKVKLMDLNHCLKLSSEPIYSCLQLLHSTKYITFQELQCNSTQLKIFLTSYYTNKHIFKNHIILADVITIKTNDAIAVSTFLVRIE